MIAGFSILFFLLPGHGSAGSLEPSGPPASTMKTLNQIPPAWSQTLPADDGTPCNSSRFECVLNGEAVLDKETGLVWAKNASLGGNSNWTSAIQSCASLSISNRKGWRLPTVDELASLNPLPAGHPFINVYSYPARYWTCTPDPGDSTKAYYVGFGSSQINRDLKTTTNYVWAVRGGMK